MALAVDDIIQVSLRGTLFGQRIINVLHYRVTVTVSGITQLQLDDLAVSIGADTGNVPLAGDMLACVAASYTLDEVRAQRVYPTRSPYSQAIPGNAGTHAGTCRTANIALSITKRGDVAGRTGIGRFQLAGLPDSAWVSGSLDVATFAGVLNPFRSDLAASYNPAIFAITYVPVIYNPAAAPPKYTTINSWIIQESARTMHRRTLFLGV